jgi:DtxR family Mn-dependent transcriptional regulator
MRSTTAENYVKQLYIEQQQRGPGELVSMGGLAAAMDVVPGTATTMVKALADAGLVDYEPRNGVRLTPHGQQLALHVLRRHRLLELFLVDVLGLDWSEVHEDAEQLEHVVSDRVVEKIDEMLKHPSVDPHGDPIPTSQGKVKDAALQSLSQTKSGQAVRIIRILKQDPKFLRFVEDNGLTPGQEVVVINRDMQAEAITVRPATGKPVTLGLSAATKILIG